MYRTLIKTLSCAAVLFLIGFLVSCQKDESVSSDVDNFVNTSAEELQRGAGLGLAGCYELVFPVTLQFADSTTLAVNSYDELKQAIHDWYLANGGSSRPHSHPTLVFPFQVTNDAGEIITVENRDQLKALIALCRPVDPGNGGGHGGGHHGGHHGGGVDGNPCFTVNYPYTIQFPDSSQVVINSLKNLKLLSNPGKKTILVHM